jgi:hypothetical protein
MAHVGDPIQRHVPPPPSPALPSCCKIKTGHDVRWQDLDLVTSNASSSSIVVRVPLVRRRGLGSLLKHLTPSWKVTRLTLRRPLAVARRRRVPRSAVAVERHRSHRPTLVLVGCYPNPNRETRKTRPCPPCDLPPCPWRPLVSPPPLLPQRHREIVRCGDAPNSDYWAVPRK